MLSRAPFLFKFNTFIRQLNKNISVTNQFRSNEFNPIVNEKTKTVETLSIDKNDQNLEKSNNKIDTNFSANDSSNTIDKKYEKKETLNNEKYKNLNKKNSSQLVLDKNNRHPNEYKKFTQENRNQLNKKPLENKNFKKDGRTTPPNLPNSKKLFQEILDDIQKNYSSQKDFLLTIQGLINASEMIPDIKNLFDQFENKQKVTNKLNEMLNEKIDGDDFLNIICYMSKFDLQNFNLLGEKISSKIINLNADQLVLLVNILRSTESKHSSLKENKNNAIKILRTKIDSIEKFSSIILAMKIFHMESFCIQQLDNKILQSNTLLSLNDWIILLNTKSILRLRNMSIIETCAYNIMELSKNKEKILDISSIQKCLLSCGILSYNDEQFYLFLLKKFDKIFAQNKNNSNWFDENKANIISILNSIGILQLKDNNVLSNLFNLLLEIKFEPNFITSFLTSCSAVNFQLNSEKLKKLISEIKLEKMVQKSEKDKMIILNFVWSLCFQRVARKSDINFVLDKNFYLDLLNENNIYLKPIVSRLLLINVYAQLMIKNYDGQLLPDDFNSQKYINIFTQEKNSMNENLLSTLSSYRTAEKYFKSEMLTPFGIKIDALMVIDKKGIPLELNKFLNENLELKTQNSSEKKIAFKLVDYKELTKIVQDVNGNISFQKDILKELGYTCILLSHKDLFDKSVIKRVELIKEKLKNASEIPEN